MAYIYLFNLYDMIDLHIQEAQDIIAQEGHSPEQIRYQEGRVDILKEFKAYLTENMNNKLPRRMQKKLK